jgi:DNA-binding NarL/FixJ family response regulator
VQAEPARVALVDDHALIREGIRRAIDRCEDFVVAAEAAGLDEARAVLRRNDVDVLIVDVRLGDGNGLDLVRQMAHERPELAIVVLTMYAGDGQVLDARDAGASAFVSKDEPTTVLLDAARAALQHPRSFSAPGLPDVLARVADGSVPRLTGRETEVLSLLVEGYSVAAISRRLFISESTTKTHIGNIYTKLGAANRAQAVATALREGLVEPE